MFTFEKVGLLTKVIMVYSRCSLKKDCILADRAGHFITDASSKCPSVISFQPMPAAVSVREQIEVCFYILASM